MKMYATISFDRDIDEDKHYISPGGYEMTFVDKHGLNPKTVSFDFFAYYANVDRKYPNVLHCEMEELDIDTFPEAKFLKHFNGMVSKINEFYIYTGEPDEPEINPVELLEIRLINDDGNYIHFYDGLRGQIWKEVKND